MMFLFHWSRKRIPTANMEANSVEYPLRWNGYSGYRRQPYSHIHSASTQKDENSDQLFSL